MIPPPPKMALPDAAQPISHALDYQRIRDGVITAITTLGHAFLAHPANETIRTQLRTGRLSAPDYYHQVLRLVYRTVILLTATQAGLCHSSTDLIDDAALVRVLPALNGWLFSSAALPVLATAAVSDQERRAAVRVLAAHPILPSTPEMLGSVYESLLELHPVITLDPASFTLVPRHGYNRKTTGSYYTPASLIDAVLDEALEPVLDDAVRQPDPAAALVRLTVLDPACGSGHFLLAAGRRLARRLAQVQTGEAAPPPTAVRAAMREVVGRCLYGVDRNPMAVELCKVSLWLEARDSSMPLMSLDHQIRCGNSLIGVPPAVAAAILRRTGDDRAAAWREADQWCVAQMAPVAAHTDPAVYQCFHWQLAFPEIFRRCATDHPVRADGWTGGFDVVIGNPPWERMKLHEREQFADAADIRNAPTKAIRSRRLAQWRHGNAMQQARMAAYDAAIARVEAERRFVRRSGRFPLTAVGDLNTAALFAELSRNLLAPHGRAGMIVPTGIVTDVRTKAFFADLVQRNQVVSLYDLENREALFPSVHRSYRFCLLTIGQMKQSARYAGFLTHPAQRTDPQRVVTLSAADLSVLNPNTRTAPIFRTRIDADLTLAIAQRVPVLMNERTGVNPWGVRLLTMVHRSNDSHRFHTTPQEGLLPLYEGRLFHQFTHRWATAHGGSQPAFRTLTDDELADPALTVTPRYWVPATGVAQWLAERWTRQWLLVLRGVTIATNARMLIAGIVPRAGIPNTVHLLTLPDPPALNATLLLAILNSLVLDYVMRQKGTSTMLNRFALYQLPVLPPDAFSAEDRAFIVPRVIELVYTAWDLHPFAVDAWTELTSVPWGRDVQRELWQRWQASASGSVRSDLAQPPPPFRWNEERRAVIRADLDAHIARRYGLSRDELRYILDPADVYGSDFPSETFRVLKDAERRRFGEYRTRRLVLAAWDQDSGQRGA